jgi:hypothetical protein
VAIRQDEVLDRSLEYEGPVEAVRRSRLVAVAAGAVVAMLVAAGTVGAFVAETEGERQSGRDLLGMVLVYFTAPTVVVAIRAVRLRRMFVANRWSPALDPSRVTDPPAPTERVLERIRREARRWTMNETQSTGASPATPASVVVHHHGARPAGAPCGVFTLAGVRLGHVERADHSLRFIDGDGHTTVQDSFGREEVSQSDGAAAVRSRRKQHRRIGLCVLTEDGRILAVGRTSSSAPWARSKTALVMWSNHLDEAERADVLLEMCGVFELPRTVTND